VPILNNPENSEKWYDRAPAQRALLLAWQFRLPLGVPQVRPVFHKFFILCCALYLSGAHWMVLQTTAWTGMLVSRSVSASVSEAIESTFDGRHPCRMCEAISSGKQSEERSQMELKLLKKGGELKFVEFRGLSAPPPLICADVFWPVWIAFSDRCAEAPPTPPPLV
jgi:hypothetical protein